MATLTEQLKACTRCGEEKPASEFYRRKAECKECSRQRTREWRAANPERAQEACARWREENPERHRETARLRDRAYRERHPDKEAERHRRRLAENPEREAAYTRAHRERHPEKAAAREAVAKAIKDGALTKPEHCEDCGESATGRDLHGHHPDYSKPLEVDWLCRGCHKARHVGG